MANDITLSTGDITSARISVVLSDAFLMQATLADESATLSAGAQFAKYLTSQQLKAGLVVYLHGDLGAGKTTFTRGFIQGLGFAGKVKSPTYTLVEPYVFSSYNIYHFDLYRFTDKEEWEASGFREYFNPQSICLIEWPEKAGDLLPEPDIHVHLTHDDLQRKVEFLVNPISNNNAIHSGHVQRFNLIDFKLE
jgi:tRNA threonylcarbamoyladenosine biosynthesis protein TsaE